MVKQINFFLLKKRKIYERLDVYPFLIAYLIIIIIFLYFRFSKNIYNFLLFGIIIFFHIILYCLESLSIFLQERIIYLPVDSIKNATHIKAIINSEKDSNYTNSVISEIIKFGGIIKTEVKKLIYLYDENKKKFYRAKLDMLKETNVGKFLEVKPLNKEEIKIKKIIFGENKIKIPIPSFLKVYKEHIFTPFFIFQLICAILKIFDTHTFYSLISIIMTCIFEIIIVIQRMLNLGFLRNMRSPPYYIYVYRNDKWEEISSTELLPGDIVSVIDGASVKSVKEEKEKSSKNNLIIQIIKRLKENNKKEDEIKNRKSINTVLNKYKEKEKLPVACDMLILTGSVIVNESMLTGEGVPQIKDSITKMEHLHELNFDSKYKHKNLIIFAGTKVVKTEVNEDNEPLPKNVKIPPPDKGVICLVIKTGFSTTQGKFLRRVLYSEENNNINNKIDSVIIIGILLIIAIISSLYTLYEVIKIEGKLTRKLLMRCIIIITSIIPADLPIEFSLIIYNSRFFFESKRIVCIESHRIPLAGKIDICCFDKTGTLTTDEFIVKGIADTKSDELELAFYCKEEAFDVLLGCNSILNLDGRLSGDPIDIAMFKEVRGKFDNNSNEVICKRKTKIIPIRKYVFESDLKRMTVLAKIFDENNLHPHIRVLCKGAPETIKNLLKNVPENYDKTYQKWAKEGYRIFALAYNDNDKYEYNTKRKDLEKDLIFCGFAIVEAPLKHNIDKYISELIDAKYGICIITGDNVLTTLKISRDLKLGPDNFILLNIFDGKLKWYDLKNNFIKETKSIEEIKLLSKDYTLGITGDEYDKIKYIKNFKYVHEISCNIKLFCRITQIQKISIIKDLIKSGKNPLMCGDGSNDVGALKLATIGITMLNIKENKIQKKKPFNLLSFDNEATMENLDAAAFAPFTSKGDSIKCVKNILVQGICALATSNQMYKIIILNSLLTIYTESFLALKGIKFSEYQSVYLGFTISMLFLMFSKTKPLKKINAIRPQSSIFNFRFFFSIMLQLFLNVFEINLVLYFTRKADPFYIEHEPSINEKFSPNLINSVMFLLQIFNITNIFIANYKGEPFMQNFSENSFMIKLLLVFGAFFLIIAFDLYPQLNEDLELVQLPEDYYYKIILFFILLLNFTCCYLLENWEKLMIYF